MLVFYKVISKILTNITLDSRLGVFYDLNLSKEVDCKRFEGATEAADGITVTSETFMAMYSSRVNVLVEGMDNLGSHNYKFLFEDV